MRLVSRERGAEGPAESRRDGRLVLCPDAMGGRIGQSSIDGYGFTVSLGIRPRLDKKYTEITTGDGTSGTDPANRIIVAF